MKKEVEEEFYPKSQQEWRQWLQENHLVKQSVWLVYYKKRAGLPTLNHSEAVDEALCFGWIDSTCLSVGEDKYIQFFCPRKPRSVWSKINKTKIENLLEKGLMAPAGMKCIEIAKQNGYWTMLDEVEELTVPEDLTVAFSSRPGAEAYFLSLSKSVKKSILQWVVLARRPETRQKRIVEISDRASQGLKPTHLLIN